MCQDSTCQTTKIKGTCLVSLPLALKDALRAVFEKRYKPDTRITWGPFQQDWTREIDALVPTPPTVRAILYQAHRRSSQYQIINGFCQLLLDHQCYEECIQAYRAPEPDGPAPHDPGPDDDQATEPPDPLSNKKTMRENISRRWSTPIIGRKDGVQQMLEWLAESESGPIAITGLGGIGKTTLAVTVALQCLEIAQTITDDAESIASTSMVLPRFDTIIFISARQRFLEDAKVHIANRRDRTLNHLISTIAKTLDSEADGLALAKQGCNIPGVILYAVGQIAAGATVPYVLQSLRSAQGELAFHLFETAIAPLRHQPSHHLLMALALFPQPPLPEVLAAVAFDQTNPMATEKGVTTLLKLSLIERWTNAPTDSPSPQLAEPKEIRYTMLPLTREFVLAELQAHLDFAHQARERWIQWYCHWTTAIAHETDWRRWNQPDALVQDWGNVQAVIEEFGCPSSILSR